MAFSFKSKHVKTLGVAFVTALAFSACISDSGNGGGEPGPAVGSRQFLIDSGAVVYTDVCAGCHGESGEGSRGPRLHNSDFVMGSKTRLIKTVLAGNTDSIQVNGVWYAGGGMPPHYDVLTDLDAAALLTYIRVVFNDSLVTNCVAVDEFSANCEFNPRPQAEIDIDSVSVDQVAHVRDSLGLGYPVKRGIW